jgi:hypothetical protein
VVLLAGVVWGQSLLPRRAVPWGSVSELDVSSEDCEERREEKQVGSFTLSARQPEPVPWSEVARWFRLDPAEVCAMNGVAAADCGERRLAPGEEVAIPLRHHAPGPPSRVRAPVEAEP